jgi:hypothetical protein
MFIHQTYRQRLTLPAISKCLLWSLHLMIPRHSLLIRRWDLLRRVCLTRRSCTTWLHEPALVPRELIARRRRHCAVALLWSTTRSVLRVDLSLYLVVCGNAPLFRIRHLLVGRIWCDGNDVPGVEETWEEAEHCAILSMMLLNMRCIGRLTAKGNVDEGVC